MVEKALSSQSYSKLTDRYAHDALDQLTSYVGYDGYQQQFTYDVNGMRLSKKETGDTSRSTLEELLRGNIAGLPEIVVQQAQDDAADVPEELAWATTDYLYDITQEYYQVISETRTETNGHTATTAYAYGLERIAAYTADSKTSYVYDGRGSVAQAVTAPVAGEKVSSALPDVTVKVQSFSYTAFGEQMSTQKVSGFAYNAEAYDAATGMTNLRARQYEPTIGRFEQKDVIYGASRLPLSLNRYIYCINSPYVYIDLSGMKPKTLKTSSKTFGDLKNSIKSINSTLKKVKQSIGALTSAIKKGFGAAKNIEDENVKAAYTKALNIIREKERNENRTLSVSEKDKIFATECTLSSLRIANKFGKETTEKMSGDETKNIYEYFRYANHSTEKSERKNINSNREKKFNTSIISPKKNDPLCAGYIFNTISLRGTKLPTSKLFEYLKNQKAKDRKVGNTTTPQYAALSGGITRSSTTPKNDGFIAPEVRFVVSISNKEDITIKLPEDTEYITIEGTKSLNYEEQWKLLLEADVIQPNDILYIGDGKNDRYIDMYHVVFMDSQETYSGQNSSVINGSVFETYIKPYIDSNSDNRLYFILVNSDEEMNEKLLEMYK